MEIIKTKFSDVLILKPKIFNDDRGYYVETFQEKKFKKLIGNINFIQDNESQSAYGVLRGFHFQEPPYTQAKLIRVVSGAIIDVIIDIKTDSETFGEMLMIKLDDINKEQLLIPRGYAHGFVAIEPDTIIQYKVDNDYAPKFESGIAFDSTNIDFREEIGHEEFILSEKDLKLKPFTEVGFFTSNEYKLNA
ncbi:MAG: dTDP-4-dehydrorhamnose 3,5-epimerase [Patescibacteria group bacterium]|nr:dTDP-4-dehydrorhamnose 3,5-epimerase [Patescibacteria group bacterium]